MKTSLATALKDAENNGASSASLSSTYQVPDTKGRLVLATPLKFCLNFRPPTIAVVYTLEKSKKTAKSGKPRKYIHEIRVDFEACKDPMALASAKPTLREVEKLCRKLCDQEATYLNINIISKTQVLNLIMKLYEKKFGCLPTESPKQVASGKAPGAPVNLHSAKPKKDDEISDDYDDDFDDQFDDKPKNGVLAKDLSSERKGEDDDDEDEERDDWGLADDDWGDLDDMSEKDNKKSLQLGGKAAKPTNDKNLGLGDKKRNLFFGQDDDVDDVADLDDLPELGSNFPGKNEDKFNMVMSSSKEGGGLLASIGLKKDELNKDESLYESQEEDPHKKSNLFDNSKDRISGGLQLKGGDQLSDEEDFDLGFGSSRKDKDGLKKDDSKNDFDDNDAAAFEAELAGMSENDDGPISGEQQQAIHEQFQLLYEKDPELQKALEKSDVASFSIAEKYQIIEAYMQDGAAGLQIELEDEDEDDEKILMEMSEEEHAVVEAQFEKLFSTQPELQSAIGSAENLTLLQKYQILVQYQQQSDMQGTSNDQYFSGDEMTEIIEHEGKKFRRVQIEGTDGDHLMDDDANIYTLDFEKIGKAGESDEDDDEI